MLKSIFIYIPELLPIPLKAQFVEDTTIDDVTVVRSVTQG